MSYFPLLFWAALVIPGYALLCRFDRDELKSGLPGVLALSYLATFVLISPVAIAGYWLRFPLIILSAWCVLLVAAGLVEIVRGGHWRRMGQLLMGALGVELLLLLIDLVGSARVGTILGGDAIVHLGRVRFLLDHGLSNLDPVVAGEFFYPIYHTNILHALCAAGAQLTGGDYLSVWMMALPLAKLLVVGASFYLAWTVFERHWPAWTVAVFVLVAQGPVRFLPYPNKLAPLCVLVFMFAFVVELWRRPSWRPVIKLAGGALLLSQLHVLYGGFALILLGPVLGVLAVLYLVQRRPGAGLLGAAAAALLVCMPLTIATQVNRARPARARAAAQTAVEPSVNWEHFIRVGDDMLIRDPRRGFGGWHGYRLLWLAGGVTCAWLVRRERETVLLMSVAAIAAAIFFFPPLCSAAIRVLSEGWILRRLEIVWYSLLVVFVPGAVAALLGQRWIRVRWLQSVLSLAVIPLSLHMIPQNAPYDWRTYGAIAASTARERTFTRELVRDTRRMLAEHLPPGATVLADPGRGMRLVQAYDCRLIAPRRGSMGVPGLQRKRKDVWQMLSDRTPETERRELLDRYGIEYLFTWRELAWVRGAGVRLGETRAGQLWQLLTTEEVEDAVDRLEVYLKDHPEDVDGFRCLTQALVGQQRWAEAEAAFKRFLRVHPREPVAHYEYGNLLLSQQRWEEALQEYSAAVALDSTFPDAYCNRAYVLIELDRVDESLRDLQAALALDERHVLAHYHRARALLLKGDRAGAIADLERALEVAPNHNPTRRLLERIRAGQ